MLEEFKALLEKSLTNKTDRYWLDQVGLEINDENDLCIVVSSDFIKSAIEKKVYSKIKSVYQLKYNNKADCVFVVDKNFQKTSVFERSSVETTIVEKKQDDIVAETHYDLSFFDELFVGGCNNLAITAAKNVVVSPGKRFNPLFVYGKPGVGKTHLLKTIEASSKSSFYIDSESFLESYINGIKNKDIDVFKNKIRSVDILLIDDIQFMNGKEAMQEEFFHTFNALLDRNHQMILTCDKYPKEIDGLEERLKSRLGWGLPVIIEPPELETRAAVLLSKANSMGVTLPNDCAIYIAQRIRSNIRELEGALKRVVANSRFANQEIDIPFVKEALKDLFVISAKMVSIENIQKTTAEYYNIKLSDLLSKRRSRSITRPRQMAMALTKQLTNHSLPEIGEAFNGRDHTTVLHACKKIAELRKESPSHEEDYRNLNRALTN